MDAQQLSEARLSLKRRDSMDRSAPRIDDAAHPGSAGVLRAISVGHFELKHVQEARDASSPLLEPGTKTRKDVRPEVLAEVQSARRDSLKPTKSNDRSEPVIERWVHISTSPPARKSVVDELKEKRSSIEALATYNEHNAKDEIEKFTRTELMSELKSHREHIEEKSEWAARNSKSELAKNVHTNLVEEVRQKRQSIQDFTAYAAAQKSEEVFRAQQNPSLVKEIHMKRNSIHALTAMHNQNSSKTIGVN